MGEGYHKTVAITGGGTIGEIVEPHIRFAIMHAVALKNDGLPDGLGQMTFAGAARAQNKASSCLATKPSLADSKVRPRFIRFKAKSSCRVNGADRESRSE